MTDDRLPPDLRSEILASFDRLVQAGLLESYSFDGDDEGSIVLSPALAKLFRAGRRLEFELYFQRILLGGDPKDLKSWVEAEAASLPDD